MRLRMLLRASWALQPASGRAPCRKPTGLACRADRHRTPLRRLCGAKPPSSDPITMARSALADLRAERGAAYRSDMGALSQDKSILDFTPIDQAIAKLDSVKNFKGVDIDPATAGVRAQIKDAVNTWKSLPPA